MTDKQFNLKIKAARKRVAELDKVDGCPINGKTPLYLSITTCFSALEAGLKMGSEDVCFEALVMLQEVVEGVRTIYDVERRMAAHQTRLRSN